ncbi:hypothetical protein ACIRRH_31600 [Kitasatospora sp. NPDC101235]|uniref:hypothetical protein n=1 Tax=Kitasatospora sp. NPDC101235 TaxID=3364101 RepID=UPI00382975E1
MYSYDVSASPGRSATASRSIPGMRPSYDAEHPHSTTPIYDELYSEFRRLFRALPGDRSGEEDLKFTGFAVRDGYPLLGEQRAYPPQQQAFHTLAGQAPGLPQFVPGPQHHGSGATGGRQHGHTGAQQHSHAGGHTGTHVTADTHAGTRAATPTGSHTTGSHTAGSHAGGHTGRTTGHHRGHSAGHPEPTAPTNDGPGHTTAAPAPAQPAAPAAQFTNGQGWVAAGYLGAAPHPMPVPTPAPPAPPAPSPVMGTATGLAAAPSTGGRHRQMLSLPPGSSGDHR